MISVLLLEDEYYNREFIRKLLGQIPEISDIFDTTNGEEAILIAQKYKPDIILLDIELENNTINGIEVAKRIYKKHKESYMVFVTGYSGYAVESFAVHPFGYILKPINIPEFTNLIKEIVSEITTRKSQYSNILICQDKNQEVHIKKNDIVFIEVMNHISYIHIGNNRIIEINWPLDKIQDHLSSQFLRVHRSYIVNLDKIDSISEVLDRSYQIKFVDCSETALMSRYFYPQYKKLIESRIG